MGSRRWLHDDWPVRAGKWGDLLDALADAVCSLERVEAQAKDAGASDQGRAELRAMRERLDTSSCSARQPDRQVIGKQIQNYRRR